MNFERILKSVVASNSLTFREEVTASYSGQSNLTLSAYQNDILVGFVDYTIFQGEIAISLVEVKPEYRNKGFGKQIIRKLQSLYPKKEIQWGMMTGEGMALYNSMKSELYVDRERIMQKKLFDQLKEELVKIEKKWDVLHDEMAKASKESEKTLIRDKMNKLQLYERSIEERISKMDKKYDFE